MRWLTAAVVLVVSTGCGSVHRYGTARTLPRGELTHLVVLDNYRAIDPEPEPDAWPPFVEDDPNESFVGDLYLPVVPRYVLRYGLSDSIEGGLEISPSLGFGMDAKFELLRSERFDLALAPGGVFGFALFPNLFNPDDGGPFVVMGEARLSALADVVLSRWAVLVPHASIAALFLSAGGEGQNEPMGSAGLGLHLRVADGFAIVPGLELHRFLSTGAGFWNGAVAFQFGALPVFE